MGPDARDGRGAALRARLAQAALDGLIVTHPANLRYLTGFTGSAGVVLVTADDTVLVTDFRYGAQGPAEVGPHARVEIAPHDVWERVGVVMAGRTRGAVFGFEEDAVSVATARRMAERVRGAELRPVAGMVEGLRLRKEAEEIAAVRAAAALAGEAFAAALPAVRPGVAELEIAAVLERELRRRGSEWHPFPTIVASGPRSALPHARSSTRVVERDDLVLLDFGAQVDGYCADLTRTVVAGRADERQRMAHALVREAQARALTGLRAGLRGRDADALARGVIAQRGFGDAFGHSLGHGLGLEVHEAPRLGRASDDEVPADAVVTLEPGVYFPGWGGVRLEDDVRVTPDGAERLSAACGELLELVS